MAPDLWIEVSDSALRHNFRVLKEALNGTPIIAVVKANGYGHGLVEAGRIFAEEGALMLAVTRLDEAIRLREGGVEARIILLTPPLPENRIEAARLGFVQPLDSVQEIPSLPAGEYHLKMDTGMGRLGILPSEISALSAPLKLRPDIQISGTFTHFAEATAKDAKPVEKQLETFNRVLADLTQNGIELGLRHAANSVAAFRFPLSQLDAVRLGTVLYGQFLWDLPIKSKLQPTWKARARVIAIRELPKGATVGYGSEITLCRPTRIAVLPVGFADGFTMSPDGPRRRQSLIKTLVDRKRVPSVKFGDKSALVLGRVSMQLTSVDVTDLPDVQIGSIAEIPMLRLAADTGIPRLVV